MKTFFKSILAVAVCASLFAACSKDDTVSDPSNGRKVTMTVSASSELESASGSRTTYDPLTGKVSWNAPVNSCKYSKRQLPLPYLLPRKRA